MTDCMQYAVWEGFADLEGVGTVDDVSFLDDWSHEDALKAHCKRLGAEIEKELTMTDDILEVGVRHLKHDLECARTPEDVDDIEARINLIDSRWHHPRPLSVRLAKPLARHRRRVESGYVCIPLGISFPVRMVKGRSEASAATSRDYKYWYKQGYNPVYA
jgi:hypothetical protein